MRRSLVSAMAALAIAGVSLAGCGGGASTPTTAPTKAPEATKSSAPAATTAPAAAQPTAAPAAKKVDYPVKGKTIQIIVPVNAGGGSDVSTRLMTPAMEKILGTSVEVVNKPGAGQQVGHTEFSKSKPDGYILDMTNLPTTLTTYLDKDRQAVYNRKTFIPVAAPVMDPGIIVVKGDSPWKTLQDLVDAAKARPGTIKATTTGILSAPHLELLATQKAAGIRFATVHFDGAAPATTALLGGHVDVQFAYIGDMGTQLKSGQVRPLAVLADKESPFLPGIKTAAAQGYKVEQYVPRGYSVVAGTPPEIVATLEDAFKKVSQDSEVQKKQNDLYLTQQFLDSKAYGDFWDKMEAEIAPVIDEAKKDAGTQGQ